MDSLENAVGIARAGDRAHSVVLVQRYTDDAWVVYYADMRLSPTEQRFGETAGDYVISGDAALARVLDGWDVQWLEEPQATEIEERYLGLR